jgi:MFS family permease
MISQQRRAVAATQNDNSFGDVGIVYRDHKIIDEDDDDAPAITQPLSIDDDNNDPLHQNSSSQEFYDDDDDESGFISLQRHPAYTPQLLFSTHPHLAVLPVLLFEFLALALTRSVLPSLLLKRYGSRTYIIMGAAECIRGILAFFACPLFGKLSDVWGRRPCLLITVMGTLAPVCSLAFWRSDGDYHESSIDTTLSDNSATQQLEAEHILDGVDSGDASPGSSWFPTLFSGMDSEQLSINILPSLHRIDVFVILFALSGVFASTFTLTFAYISDVVKDRDGRVAAYGLALATFGLSFTVGPLLGGYLANVDDDGKGQGGRSFLKLLNTDDNESPSPEHIEQSSGDIHPIGQHRVFLMTLVLAVLDLFYIHFILPESLNHSKRNEFEHSVPASGSSETGGPSTTAIAQTSSTSNVAIPGAIGVSRRASSSWWNPLESIRFLTTDPLLSSIGRITILYYTALHAVVSTLILYAARQFHLGPHRLGEIMAALGLSTMLSEAVLVRIAIPALGEPRSMRVGLMSFTLQCVLLAVARSPWHIFFCASLAIPGNLVYPSISSLISTSVKPEMVGRALGSINGVKSLTEGVGPLIFGTLLTISEHDALPGWPYFIAAIMSALAWHATKALPEGDTKQREYYMAGDEVDYEEMEPFTEKDNA